MKVYKFRIICNSESGYILSYNGKYKKCSPGKWFVGTKKEARVYSHKHNVVLIPSKEVVSFEERFQYEWRGRSVY